MGRLCKRETLDEDEGQCRTCHATTSLAGSGCVAFDMRGQTRDGSRWAVLLDSLVVRGGACIGLTVTTYYVP